MLRGKSSSPGFPSHEFAHHGVGRIVGFRLDRKQPELARAVVANRVHSLRPEQQEHGRVAVELAMLGVGFAVFSPVQRPFRAGKNNRSLAATQVIVIAAHRAWLGCREMDVANHTEEFERLVGNDEAKATRVATIG